MHDENANILLDFNREYGSEASGRVVKKLKMLNKC